LRDLDQVAPAASQHDQPKRICLLGFSWTASSLLEEITRQRPDLLAEIVVLDFNPNVHEKLRKRQIHAVYGDITQRDVLHHAGVAHAEMVICSLPNMVLKGADNLKILRQLRDLNPALKIVVHAELLSDIPVLYAAGASYVTVPRLLEADDLLQVVEAAEQNLLEQKRAEQSKKLSERAEVIP
jgi:Trk K+ transport system NAD-binding subunit